MITSQKAYHEKRIALHRKWGDSKKLFEKSRSTMCELLQWNRQFLKKNLTKVQIFISRFYLEQMSLTMKSNFTDQQKNTFRNYAALNLTQQILVMHVLLIYVHITSHTTLEKFLDSIIVAINVRQARDRHRVLRKNMTPKIPNKNESFIFSPKV